MNDHKRALEANATKLATLPFQGCVKHRVWLAKAAEIYDEVDGKTVAVIPGVRCDEPTPAEALLIAAAPDLLAACDAALFRLESEAEVAQGDFWCLDLRRRLRDAINKAEGL